MDGHSKGSRKTEHLRPRGKQTYSAEIGKQSLKITWTQIFSSVRSNNIFEKMIKGEKPTGNTKKDFLPQHSRGIRNTNTLPSALPFSMINLSSSSLTEAKFSSVQFSRSVMSNSLRPHGSQHARPPCPLPTPRVHPNSRASSQ